MNAIYTVYYSFGSKVWPRCELHLSNEESQTDTQTWQKLDAPKFHSWAIKQFQTEITSHPNVLTCAKYMFSPISTYLPQNWHNIRTKCLWNTMPPVVTRSVKRLFQHNGYDQGHEVGWLYWGFTLLQRYFIHIATWKQEITISEIQVTRPGIEPRTSCSASKELNHSATVAPNVMKSSTLRCICKYNLSGVCRPNMKSPRVQKL